MSTELHPPPEIAAAVPQENPFASWFGTILRSIAIYWVVSSLTRSFSSPSTGTSTPTVGASLSQSVWDSKGTVFDLDVYLSEQAQYNPSRDLKGPLFHFGELSMSDWDSKLESSGHVDAPISVTSRNASMYAHIYFRRQARSPIQHDPHPILYLRHEMTHFLPKQKAQIKKHLLSSTPGPEGDIVIAEKEEPTLKEDDKTIVSYWYPNITLHLVPDAETLNLVQLQQLPPQFRQYIRFANQNQTSHFPLIYVTHLWTLQEDILNFPLNASVKHLPVQFYFAPISMWRMQLMVQLEESFRLQHSMMGIDTKETDQLRRMFLETSPWLLAVTFIVSILHSLFDFLAFKNDIQFWKERDHVEGLSMRSVLLNVLLQTIVFLYLFDNETSWLILISNAVGLAIEVWKIRKVMRLDLNWETRSLWGLLPFRLTLMDRYPRSQRSRETDVYDRQAFMYLGWASIPLVLGYAVYSLIYEQHRNWYSWCLGTAVGFVYTFGFITMTPQLFINYKLKSVANMPWRTFMYKALNTFVDDLFAFVIKMPTLHRLACFRDDIIFLVYMYQRWIYPEDKSRANEYGQVGEVVKEKDDDDDTTEEKKER